MKLATTFIQCFAVIILVINNLLSKPGHIWKVKEGGYNCFVLITKDCFKKIGKYIYLNYFWIQFLYRKCLLSICTKKAHFIDLQYDFLQSLYGEVRHEDRSQFTFYKIRNLYKSVFSNVMKSLYGLLKCIILINSIWFPGRYFFLLQCESERCFPIMSVCLHWSYSWEKYVVNLANHRETCSQFLRADVLLSIFLTLTFIVFINHTYLYSNYV